MDSNLKRNILHFRVTSCKLPITVYFSKVEGNPQFPTLPQVTSLAANLTYIKCLQLVQSESLP